MVDEQRKRGFPVDGLGSERRRLSGPGAWHAEGDTVEEAVFNCVDVAKLILAYRAERNDSPTLNTIELTPNTRMTVAVPVGVA